MSTITVRHLARLDRAQSAQICQIYLASFPAKERTDFPALVETINRGERSAYTVEDEQDLCGFAILKPLSLPGVHLLEYMAVSERSRNKGLGSILLREVAKDLAKKGNQGILLEIERPEDGDKNEQDLRKRRLGFYIRNGAHALDSASGYRMPDQSRGGSLPMGLLWMPLQNQAEPLSDEELRKGIISIYTDVYKKSEDDPLLQMILKSLPS